MMDTILQGLLHVTCYIDDILVIGSSDSDHLSNLAAVLKWLQQHGLCVKKEKCHFMQQSVEYLGHQIDAEGIKAISSKLEAIVQAREPQNVCELCSF